MQFALLLLLLATRLSAQAPDEGEACTLDRQQGAMVVAGERLPTMLGAPIERLRLFAARDGVLKPIAFQVDERTPEGGYAFDLSLIHI